jgi:hypothetical protein
VLIFRDCLIIFVSNQFPSEGEQPVEEKAIAFEGLSQILH